MPSDDRAHIPPNAIQPANRAAWRAWLEEHHARQEGIRLVYYKKAYAGLGLTYEEAVEEALCFGWIDSKSNKLDDRRALIWFAPRRPGSVWAQSNKERVARLTAAGLMAPADLTKVEAAKRDGAWSALDDLAAQGLPADLEQALAGNPPARANFDAYPASVRQGLFYWLASSKRPETRARRVAEIARLAAENRRPNQ